MNEDSNLFNNFKFDFREVLKSEHTHVKCRTISKDSPTFYTKTEGLSPIEVESNFKFQKLIIVVLNSNRGP